MPSICSSPANDCTGNSFYQDSTNKLTNCLPCMPECLTCSGTTLDNAICKTCRPGMFHTASDTCSKCDPECLTCEIDASIYKSCRAGYLQIRAVCLAPYRANSNSPATSLAIVDSAITAQSIALRSHSKYSTVRAALMDTVLQILPAPNVQLLTDITAMEMMKTVKKCKISIISIIYKNIQKYVNLDLASNVQLARNVTLNTPNFLPLPPNAASTNQEFCPPLRPVTQIITTALETNQYAKYAEMDTFQRWQMHCLRWKFD
ncbi:hypothetical protein SS50377_21426 [Spironucleus salmonicida]|uniref:Cysteine-rich protein n=1 Tax=Spironucleus salmonicida TaxID=348837 RepID=V6LD71_9EUKA|nr:hypothetical protein SS50377_21426 [Spironucleus salmonicida]|eukprot:EST42450.1 hypothetical protein SS50377_18018 [Spironucleus salmonicida]